MRRLRVLLALTYYRPHVSGLTIYAERLARGLAARGHQVTVLTSRFDPQLPADEHTHGVRVVRVPVLLKVSKGVIMPRFPLYANMLVRAHDVVNIHMPQFEAALLAALGRFYRKAVVLTYQCDLRLPDGVINRLVQWSLHPLNAMAARLSHRIVTTSADYAAHSRFLSGFGDKVLPITPLVEMPPPEPSITDALAQRWSLNGCPRIGFAARFAAEKGVEYLLEAIPHVLAETPNAQLVFTGAYKDTVGEEHYRARLQPLIDRYADHLLFLDLLRPEEMPSFYELCDVLAVTSLNRTEAFGLVQVESMLSGTPVVATDLPGVREAVRRTGMGEIVPPRDPPALAAALTRIIRNPDRYRRGRSEISALFDFDAAVRAYEQLFTELQ